MLEAHGSFSLLDHMFPRNAVCQLDYSNPERRHIEHAQIGDDAVHHAGPGQWQRASTQQFCAALAVCSISTITR